MSETPTPTVLPDVSALPPVDDANAFLGRTIDGYRVDRLLGEGGMAWVFQVSMAAFEGAKAALKMPKRAGASDAELKQLFSHFEHEASVVFGLRNQHIVHPRAYGHLPDGRPYLVMDLLEGSTLADLLVQQAKLPMREALRFAIQLSTGLAAAHQAGVIHRDLKPGNIFVDTHETSRVAELDVPTLRLTDFGLAFRAGRDAMHAGTPEYLSPEQARGDQPDARADLYSLGIVLFEMVGGRLPFTGKEALEVMQHHLSTPAPDVRTAEETVPEDVALLIARLLEKDPSKRYQSATELRNALEIRLKQLENRSERTNVVKLSDLAPQSAISTERVLPRMPAGGPKTDEALAQAFPAKKGTGALIGGAVALALILLVGGVVLLRPGQPSSDGQEVKAAPSEPLPAVAPRVEAPVPVAPAPVAPAVAEPLAPAPSPEKSGPKAVVKTVVKVPPSGQVVIAATSTCEPDADWKRGARATLDELARRAAKTSPDLMMWAADEEQAISPAISSASTRGECAAVEARLADFKRKLKTQ